MPRAPELNQAETIDVAAGILQDSAGRVLISDRTHASTMRDYWEFPGGKIRDHESAAEALRRELAEELGIAVVEPEFLCSTEHQYADFRVAIDFFLVRKWQGTPLGIEGQAVKWVAIDSLAAGTVLPADTPVIEILQKTNRG